MMLYLLIMIPENLIQNNHISEHSELSDLSIIVMLSQVIIIFESLKVIIA